ncbi:MAG: DegT/DnrJ/EryC1/StrS aminotransferase family protein [Actinomycetota bacterium]
MLRDNFLPFALPSIDKAEIAEVTDSLESGWITTGPKTAEFSRRFAKACGAKYAVPVNSCTAAMHLSLAALDISPGDEVITSPMTFCSTANVIVHVGATPVFADIDPETLNIDPAEIKKRVTSKTKAIIPVHYAGHPAALDSIMEIAGEHGLKVVEDAAHAPFAEYKGTVLGGIGDATCFSFYATKNLTTAEGGMLTTNNQALYQKASALSLHGLSEDAWDRYSETGSWYYEVIYPGFKYNMFDVQAAMGLAQLDKYERLQARRDEIAAAYHAAFAGHQALIVPVARDHVRHVWHLYPVRLRLENLTLDRAAFISEMKARNIGTSVHFIPVHLHPYYRDAFGFKRGDYPVAEDAYDRLVSLPIYPRMTDDDVKDVIAAVLDILQKHTKP